MLQAMIHSQAAQPSKRSPEWHCCLAWKQLSSLPALLTRRKETDTHGIQPGWLEQILEKLRKLNMGSRVWNTYQKREKIQKKQGEGNKK